MSQNSKIEWTDHTFNPWEGCQRVGPGCDHCYAETRNARFGGGAAPNWGPGAPRRRTSPANWRKPAAWNAAHAEFLAAHSRRQRVFCASLADVFDNAVDPAWRADLFKLIADTPNLDWLLLTKRIGNVMDMIDDSVELTHGEGWQSMWTQGVPPENVWLGATIVNQEEADRDIVKLLAVPATKRFLSMEPLLGPVDLTGEYLARKLGGRYPFPTLPDEHRTKIIDRLDWVIVGGESGHNARPMHPEWARSLRDQCATANVPFLFKQWGEWTDEDWGERAGLRDTAGILPSGEFALMSQGYVPPFDDGERLRLAGNVRLDGRMLMDRVGKRAAGRVLDGRTHDDFPEAR
jgi:protein gp37